jgi:uncharacterized cupredoxin-like copper-binding protein
MRKLLLTAGLLVLAGSVAPSSAADVGTAAGSPGAIVNVKLTDKGQHPDMSKNMGLGIGMKGDMSMAMMAVEPDKFAVPAGMVTFKVTNASADTVHEMLVVPIADMQTPLPYNDKENRVDEEAAHDLGEVAELDPGKSGELTIELKPGLYALLCNVPGHYGAGMWKFIAAQ